MTGASSFFCGALFRCGPDDDGAGRPSGAAPSAPKSAARRVFQPSQALLPRPGSSGSLLRSTCDD
jgi:hypothetical protein